ncbi:hypothetical protein BY458DRAFT_22457 [Sporodiniella umbellata]|nr:hypothetical protein BY458DRAFT_22457 [Sporodiniella umbellata]
MSSFKPTAPTKPESFTIVLPGSNKDAHEETEQLLLKNNKDFHIFFNEKKFHNHFVHHLLAAYSLGASKEKLQEIYEIHAPVQRPLKPSVIKITRDNYKQYLGKADSYASFLTFFQSEVDHFGMLDTVRRWVWHGDFLARTIGGLLHPLIHIGYGLEFELAGVVAEGLSMAACTENNYKPVTPELPELQRSSLIPAQAQSYAENAHTSARGIAVQFVDKLSKQISSSLGIQDESSAEVASDPLPTYEIPSFLQSSFLFELFVKIKHDTVFDGIARFDDEDKFNTILSNKQVTDRVNHYVQQWHLKETTLDIQTKFKDLHLLTAAALGSIAVRDDHPGKIHLDFFMMHALNSCEFVHQYISKVTPSESAILLRAHLATVIVLYLNVNRPTFNVNGFINHQTPLDSEKANNPWTLAFDRSLDCKEAHVVKAVRSCAVGQAVNGAHQDTQLNTIWLKVANMCIERDGDWTFGVGFDEQWH